MYNIFQSLIQSSTWSFARFFFALIIVYKSVPCSYMTVLFCTRLMKHQSFKGSPSCKSSRLGTYRWEAIKCDPTYILDQRTIWQWIWYRNTRRSWGYKMQNHLMRNRTKRQWNFKYESVFDWHSTSQRISFKRNRRSLGGQANAVQSVQFAVFSVSCPVCLEGLYAIELMIAALLRSI